MAVKLNTAEIHYADASSHFSGANAILGPSPADALFGRDPEPTPNTVMMYSPDAIGLGHMRRNSNIARRLTETHPYVNVVMMVGSPNGSFFDLPPRTDCIKMPSIEKVARNTWKSRKLNYSVDLARSLRGGLIKQAAEILKPRVFLVDHVPSGVWGELLPTLEMFRTMADRPRVVLGLRDILDTSNTVLSTWQREGLYDFIDRYYDNILIYGQKEVFDSGAAYGFGEGRDDMLRYCGYVCNDQPCHSPSSIRQRLGLDAKKLVVVTAGGGDDAFPMMKATMDALKRFEVEDCPAAVFITGPLMDSAERKRLIRASAGLPVSVLDMVPDVPSYLNAADLAITMGGYNTLVETLRLKKRIIVMPRRGPSAEQTIRSQLFDEIGLVRHVSPEDEAPERLSGVINDLLSSKSNVDTILSFDGLENAVKHISEFVDGGVARYASATN